MKKLKAPLLFSFAMLPIAAIAGYVTILYQLDFIDAATLATTVEQLGSVEAIIAVYIVQIMLYACLCGFFGHILSEKIGLMKPLCFQKRQTVITVLLSSFAGILLALDYWTFGAVIPGIQEADAAMLKPHVIAASILYGGIIEELMLRLFFMSLVAFVLWKLIFRKQSRIPEGVLIMANVISAILFAAGHLPATLAMFADITLLILFRCFLLNGGFGLMFGWLYRRYGIQYSMLSHVLAHVVSKLIWLLFI
ncbi:MAG: CPBP family intramembrane metalloprotease [Oscillospiraceae bacterium]|nr:CPBP family intramembrane metalloprotease [Oscillospiraceae bacterium]